MTVNAISPRARTRMTEDLFGDMAKAEEGKFDAFGPENVAPLVAFLASDEAADISGQNFVVFGGSVWVMQGWTPAGELKRDSGWTPKELADNKATLFATHPSACPPSASSRSSTEQTHTASGWGSPRNAAFAKKQRRRPGNLPGSQTLSPISATRTGGGLHNAQRRS